MSLLKVLQEVWRLLDRRQQRRLVALQLLSMIMALSTVGGIAAVLPFLTVLADPTAVSQHPALHLLYEKLHFTGERQFVTALGVMFAVVVVLSSTMSLFGSLAMNRFAFRVGDAFQTDLFAEYLHRGYGFHSRTNSATLSSNVIYETGRVTAGILRSALLLVTNLFAVVCIVVSMLLLNPLVAICAVAGLGASYAGVYCLVRDRLLRNGRAESHDFAARTQVVNEGFGAIKEVIVLQAQGLFLERFARYCRSVSRNIASTLTISQSPRNILESAAVCALVGAALYLSLREPGAGPWIAQLTFIGFAAYRLLPALQESFAATVRIRSDLAAFERIAADLKLARARSAAPAAAIAATSSSQRRPAARPRELVLRDVSFSHTPNRPAAITHLTLRVPPGTVVGLTGTNGSGKSTLIDLAAGLLVPQSGAVEIDGIALDDSTRREWQATLAYIPQHIFLLDATLAENIALGVPADLIDRERLRAVAALARLDACVASLPGGYDELLGERGARLSGGQRQRLGIARALYRDASILMMDESTAALDAAAEREIVDMLAAERRGRTMLIVAHRMSTLRHCDLIYELADGQIIRSGTPRQLLPQTQESRESSGGTPDETVIPLIVPERQREEGFGKAGVVATQRR